MAIEGGNAGVIGPVLAGRDPRAFGKDQQIAALLAAGAGRFQHALEGAASGPGGRRESCPPRSR